MTGITALDYFIYTYLILVLIRTILDIPSCFYLMRLMREDYCQELEQRQQGSSDQVAGYSVGVLINLFLQSAFANLIYLPRSLRFHGLVGFFAVEKEDRVRMTYRQMQIRDKN